MNFDFTLVGYILLVSLLLLAYGLIKKLFIDYRETVLNIKPETKTDVLPKNFSHSPDFSSVTKDGKTFYLSQSQRIFIEELYNACKNGSPGVGKDYLMERVGVSDNTRPQDLFKGDKDTWESLVRSPRQGIFELNI